MYNLPHAVYVHSFSHNPLLLSVCRPLNLSHTPPHTHPVGPAPCLGPSPVWLRPDGRGLGEPVTGGAGLVLQAPRPAGRAPEAPVSCGCGRSQGSPRAAALPSASRRGPPAAVPGGRSWWRDVLSRGAAAGRRRRGARRGRGRAGGAGGGRDRAGSRDEPAAARTAAERERAGERGEGRRRSVRVRGREPRPAVEGRGPTRGPCRSSAPRGALAPRLSGKPPLGAVRRRSQEEPRGRASADASAGPGVACLMGSAWPVPWRPAEDSQAGAQGSEEMPSIVVIYLKASLVNTSFSTSSPCLALGLPSRPPSCVSEPTPSVSGRCGWIPSKGSAESMSRSGCYNGCLDRDSPRASSSHEHR